MRRTAPRSSGLTRVLLGVASSLQLAALTAGGARADTALPMTAPAAPHACDLTQRSAPHAVTEVIDGETLKLDDGTTLRLAGVLTPRAADAGTHAAWPPADAARDALQNLVAGRSIVTASTGRAMDRYGRLRAHVFVVGERRDGQVWLQASLLSSGHARALHLPGDGDCLADLVRAEAPARAASSGLWSNPVYAVRSARRTGELVSLAGTYQIVQGSVTRAARARGGRIYLNFDSDWRNDFSVAVPPGVSRAHPAWAASLLDLEKRGSGVRVRGFVIRRNGPMIELEHPGQLELLDDPRAKDAAPAATPETDGETTATGAAAGKAVPGAGP